MDSRSNITKKISRDVAHFYAYELKDKNAIRRTITDINVEEDLNEESNNILTVTITTFRPGLIIGMGGKTFNKLEEFLRVENDPDDIKIKIIENLLDLRVYDEIY